MDLVFRRADAARGLELDASRISWTGRVDEEDDAPIVEWSFPRTGELEPLGRAIEAGDAGAIDPFVRRVPMPRGVLLAIAQRCVERRRDEALRVALGRTAGDPRFMRALSHAFHARGGSAAAVTTHAPERLLRAAPKRTPCRVTRLSSDTVAFLEDPFLDPARTVARVWIVPADGPRPHVDVAVDDRVMVQLVAPSAASADASFGVLAWHGEHRQATLWRVDRSGKIVSAHRFVAPDGFAAREVTFVGELAWIHGSDHHVVLDEGSRAQISPEPLRLGTDDAPPARRVIQRAHDGMARGVRSIDGALIVFSPARLQPSRGWISDDVGFVDLASARDVATFPWGHSVHDLVIEGERALISSDEGLFRVTREVAPVRLAEGTVFGARTIDGAILFGRGKELIAIEPAGEERWRVPLDHLVFHVEPVGRALVACGLFEWTHLGPAREVLLKSDERRDVGWARLADGTFAVSAGEEVLVLDADGTIRCRMVLAYDGRILGATAACFVFGPTDGGIPRIAPDALVALDSRGREIDRLVRTDGTVPHLDLAILDEAVIVIDGDALGRWRPHAPAAQADSDVLPIAPSRAPTQRLITSTRGETYNPRDDWPEPGLAVNGVDLIAFDGSYGGTTGVYPAAAIAVDSGAVATLVRCRLEAGGFQLRRGSTLVLVDCGGAQPFADPPEGCHVLSLGCAVANQ